jgi:hypothetical protein
MFRFVLGCLFLFFGAACHGRSVPSELPRGSAASAEAPSVETGSVVLALESDPPLEGDAVQRWRGLGEPEAAPVDHGHHHHQHGGE